MFYQDGGKIERIFRENQNVLERPRHFNSNNRCARARPHTLFLIEMVESAYVKCVFCSMNKPHKSKRYPTGVFEILPFMGRPGDAAFIMFMQQSAGPGRGRREKVGGWIKTRELSLGEALVDPEFGPIAEDFKAKLISLVKAYLENGVLEIDELR